LGTSTSWMKRVRRGGGRGCRAIGGFGKKRRTWKKRTLIATTEAREDRKKKRLGKEPAKWLSRDSGLATEVRVEKGRTATARREKKRALARTAGSRVSSTRTPEVNPKGPEVAKTKTERMPKNLTKIEEASGIRKGSTRGRSKTCLCASLWVGTYWEGPSSRN